MLGTSQVQAHGTSPDEMLCTHFATKPSLACSVTDNVSARDALPLSFRCDAVPLSAKAKAAVAEAHTAGQLWEVSFGVASSMCWLPPLKVCDDSCLDVMMNVPALLSTGGGPRLLGRRANRIDDARG